MVCEVSCDGVVCCDVILYVGGFVRCCVSLCEISFHGKYHVLVFIQITVGVPIASYVSEVVLRRIFRLPLPNLILTT